MQSTYMMIKPEIVAADCQKIGEIIAIVQKAGFRIEKIELKQLSQETVEEFYVEHKERPFYGELVDYITSGPVVALQVAQENAVVKMRELVGATNPEEASTGTIRDLYGAALSTNAVHASDSPESASRELNLVFG
jgi:nucleoside-diphosphate kinase